LRFCGNTHYIIFYRLEGGKKHGGFMKKLILCGALALALSVPGLFAEHPQSLGIGVLGRFGYGVGSSFYGGGLSLKLPSIPIFWGVNIGVGSHFFGFGVTGDKYIIDQTLTEIGGSMPFGWYLGIGGYFDFATWTWRDAYWYNGQRKDYSYTNAGFGARLPIGINLQIPISNIKLEPFLEAAPSLGLGLRFYDDSPYWKDREKSPIYLDWGIPAALGVRLWI
jgi:hypothetical protein